jgi:hypothetical protein
MPGETAVSTFRSREPVETMIAAQQTIADWLHLIRSEYLEIPGLNLTRQQVQRLWSLDAATCDALLDALLAGKFLKLTDHGAYVRADGSGC